MLIRTSQKWGKVNIDECLTWKTHLNIISKKITKKTVVRRLRPFTCTCMLNEVLIQVLTVLSFHISTTAVLYGVVQKINVILD